MLGAPFDADVDCGFVGLAALRDLVVLGETLGKTLGESNGINDKVEGG